MEEPESAPPRPSNWTNDGVGIDEHGNVVVRDPSQPPCQIRFTREFLFAEFLRLVNLESANDDLERRLNNAHPSRIIPDVITLLLKRGTEADKLRSDSTAGSVMAGQAQAYRDSAALLMGLIK